VVNPTAARIAAATANPRPVFSKILPSIIHVQRSRAGWLRSSRYENTRTTFEFRHRAMAQFIVRSSPSETLSGALRLLEIKCAWFKGEEF
jgi:hypothetical protein